MLRIKLSWLKSLLADLAGLIYPNVCQFCEKEIATAKEGYVCKRCRSDIKYIEPPFCERCGKPYDGSITVKFICSDCKSSKIYFDRARSAVGYDGIVKKALHLYKYRSALWIEPMLAQILTTTMQKDLDSSKWDSIIPVPLHFVKFNERGFNQSERLSKSISKVTAIPVNKNVLKRIKYTETQTALDKTKRSENVKNAFLVKDNSGWMNGKKIILVDDVMTTGATVNECARMLRRAGVAKIDVWTFARG